MSCLFQDAYGEWKYDNEKLKKGEMKLRKT